MDTNLEATVRTDAGGKSGSRKARRAGRVPGVVYGGGDEPTRITIDPKAFTDLFERAKSRNTVVQLSVNGKANPCIVREVQRNPLTRELLHVDFYLLTAARPVDVMIPVNPVGRPKGALLGGRLRVIRRELRARCRYDLIPSAFDVDVSELEIGDSVKVSTVSAPKGVTIVFDSDFDVLEVQGKMAGETEAAEAPAAPAAPAAAKPEGAS